MSASISKSSVLIRETTLMIDGLSSLIHETTLLICSYVLKFSSLLAVLREFVSRSIRFGVKRKGRLLADMERKRYFCEKMESL